MFQTAHKVWVPIAPGVQLSGMQLAAGLCAVWVDAPRAAILRNDAHAVVLVVGRCRIVFSYREGPLPPEQLAEAARRADDWAEAWPVMSQPEAHVEIRVEGAEDPAALMVLLTQWVTAFLHWAPAAPGVYWCASGVVRPREWVISHGRHLAADALPVALWVRVEVGEQGDGFSWGTTHGLASLGQLELEVVDGVEGPLALGERLTEIASYLVHQGPVIGEGRTLGEDAQVKMRVHVGPSEHGHAEPVLQLHYREAPRAPWWKRLVRA